MFPRHFNNVEVGSVVMARITKLYPDKVECDILCIGDVPSRSRCKGVIALSDIFTENVTLEDVKTTECFMPGDLIRARVLSLVDRQQIILGTSGPSYGVIRAFSKNGYEMRAISWRHMQCTGTKQVEMRKTAATGGKPTI
ncbi:exosome complex component CSL4 [Babesia microti strain RI]|uniref:Exosome complex component CSL4 n=1 Tax=Babesia microti (strain RI) TaxID=1133968 RepID=A0A1R4AA34_BABMR|nr:exosome complex component CSL4 [Babesia microti strain RI]SJK85859.1 exosome complex component CSL4 [Babesia microti strain RI]|eukprot:XP_012647970.2 exosome complex component CSL4 [Babesia microti strain RI]